MTRFLLVRHATNDGVDSGRLAGRSPSVHLNARGRAEALSLAASLSEVELTKVVASPLERTRETAAYLASPRGMPVEMNEGILEIDFGSWTGQKLDDLRKDPLWAGVIHAPSVTRFPGGETLLEAQQRAVAAIGALRVENPEGVVAVVSHADIIKAVLAHFAGVHIDLFQRINVSPASVSIVDFSERGPFIQCINHRDALPPAPKPKPKPEHDSDEGPV